MIQREKMKTSRRNKRFLFIAALIAFLSFLIWCMIKMSGFSRPRQTLVSTIPSPNGLFALCVYENNFGATVDFSVTVSVKEINGTSERNLYFHYHERHLEKAEWINNDTVQINDIILNIYQDYYESFDPI